MNNLNLETQEKIERGKRIKRIREEELRLNKSDLSKKIGISSQYLCLVEEGKANLKYKNIKLLRDLSNHTADYILFGLDDDCLNNTKKYLEFFSEEQIKNGLEILKDLTYVLKNKK